MRRCLQDCFAGAASSRGLAIRMHISCAVGRIIRRKMQWCRCAALKCDHIAWQIQDCAAKHSEGALP